MCGIFGLLKISFENIYEEIIEGLIQLQNRGYDSSGICLMNKDNFIINKFASSNNLTSIEKLRNNRFEDIDLKSNIGIGHNRWATHGPKNDINAHPHISNNNKFVVVHNGIIENYLEIKKFLIENNFTFYSSTDTEIIVNLIEYYYRNNNDTVFAINETIKFLSGTYGLIILNLDVPNKIFCVKNGSPLLIGKNEESCIITSEQSGFCGKVNTYITLNNDDICVIYVNDENNIILKTENNYKEKKIFSIREDLTPAPYDHWTIKEIYEQPKKILNSINLGGRIIDKKNVKLGGLDENIENLKDIDNVILLGCGTSYNSCMYGKEFMKKLCNFNVIQIFDGADFDKNDIPKIGNTLIVFVSQSGETKDLHRCVQIAKNNNLFTLGIINVVDSLIAREVNCGIYCNAGREMGVASTKAFTTQVICLCLLGLWFSQIKNINSNMRMEIIKDLQNLSIDFENCLNNIKNDIYKVVNILENKDNLFVLGKCTDESIAREGSLKIKEISYIHSEGYSSSALKHGPFALLDEDMPVILLNNNLNYESKVLNCYEEISSRNSPIIFITNNKNIVKSNTVYIPYNKSFSSLLGIIPLQLIAYYLSVRKNINPDRPKNLAKVVTVE